MHARRLRNGFLAILLSFSFSFSCSFSFSSSIPPAAWLHLSCSFSSSFLPSAWPHLRGPRFDGVSAETNLADAWPFEGPPVLWTRALGQGYSGLTVVDGKLYTQTQSAAGQSVICLDAERGDLVWQHRYGEPWRQSSNYPGPYATPTWHAGKIYFTEPGGLVGCLDAGTGQPRWSINVVKKFDAQGLTYGYACTPFIEDGKVFLVVGGHGASVVALNAEDGSTVWTSGDDLASYCSVFPITLRGQRCAVAFLRNALVVLDLKTGEPVWREQISVNYDEHSAWPLYAEPHLMISSPFRAGAKLFRLDRPPDEGLVWASKELSNDIFSSVLMDGHSLSSLLRSTQRARQASWFAFWVTALVLGLVSTTLINRLWGIFIFTWPATLFVAYQVTLMAIVWAEQQPVKERSRRISRLAILVFLGVCLGYYQACEVFGVVNGWSFLLGLFPAWPVAVQAARSQNAKTLVQSLWIALAFSAYFLGSSLFPLLKLYLPDQAVTERVLREIGH